ncbi:MAG: MOSC domain-containing protein [Synergistales bacterium]|nr:MOSC domain-containing protein [Synergistales bacterium]
MKGTIVAVCTAAGKGTHKEDIRRGRLVEGRGLEGDAHAGFAHRQVSMLSLEDIEGMQEQLPALRPGSFAENLTVRDMDLSTLQLGDRLQVGEALLELSQIGKECHSRCEIFHQTGDCIMPRKGLFFRVLRGGEVAAGDTVHLL